MKRRKIIFVVIISLAILTSTIYCINNINILDIIKLPNSIYASCNDIDYINNNKEFGKFVNIDYTSSKNKVEASVGQSDLTAKIKLFNLITIKEIKVNTKDVDLYVPGKTIGFTLNTKNLIILGNNKILTENGIENPLENSDIKKGDILFSIDNKIINTSEDINEVLSQGKEKLEIVVIRNNEYIRSVVEPKLEASTNQYKLGLWVKDSSSGVGTLTYIKKDNLRYGALGHQIIDSDTKDTLKIRSGKIYSCNVIGVTKGYKGRPGELKGLFLQGKDEEGTVDKNLEYGVYGKIDENSKLLNSEVLKAGGRFVARPGKAKIRTCIDGTTTKDYDIEIIKTNYQSVSNDKSMVIKITDKELIEKTGGIVQGMSGSPILQNGKVIGAVTHVFVNDSKKGFGIYLDWMLNE